MQSTSVFGHLRWCALRYVLYVKIQYVYVICTLTVYARFSTKRRRWFLVRIRCMDIVVYVIFARFSTLILCSLRCALYVIVLYVVAVYVIATYVVIMFSTLLHSTLKMMTVYVPWKCRIRWFWYSLRWCSLRWKKPLLMTVSHNQVTNYWIGHINNIKSHYTIVQLFNMI